MTRTLIILAAALGLSGCMTVAAATAGAAVGVTTAVVGTTAKVGAKAVGATARAIIPGDSKDDDEKSGD